MNSDIIIVTAYPDTDEKIEVLRKCLLQLKKIDKEILLCSHFPANKDIIALVNYYIYDSRNEIITKEEYTQYISGDSSYYFFETNEFVFYIRNMYEYYHYFAIYQLFESAFKYANMLGKEYFYLLEGDVIVHDEDLHQFNDIKKRVIDNNKLAYFQFNGDFAVYSVTFFFSNIEFFLKNFNFVKTKNDYIDRYKSRMFIEAAITKELDPAKDLIEIDAWGCHHNYLCAFPNSKDTTNLSNIEENTDSILQKSGFAYNNGWHLCSASESYLPLNYICELLKDGKQVTKFEYTLLAPKHYYYSKLDLDYSDNSTYTLLLQFFCNGKEYIALNLTINAQTEANIQKLYEIKWK